MELSKALHIAERTMADLAPHCFRIEIGGSIRRKKAIVGDIELVAIPKTYEIGLFESGIASVVNRWEKIKGTLPCKYTQRMLPEGIKLDLFFATPENWGLIYAIRTGSANFSGALAKRWNSLGYTSINGMLHYKGKSVDVPTEADLFKRLNMVFVKPENRDL